jgi:hypothetical protein
MTVLKNIKKLDIGISGFVVSSDKYQKDMFVTTSMIVDSATIGNVVTVITQSGSVYMGTLADED